MHSNIRRLASWLAHGIFQCRHTEIITWNSLTENYANPDRWDTFRCQRWLHFGRRHLLPVICPASSLPDY
jgi:hypothetical protein